MVSEHSVDWPWKIKHLLTGNEHRTFTRILQVNKNGLNAYDLRHLTINLRARELKLIFNLQSSPMGVLFNICTLIKSGSKQSRANPKNLRDVHLCLCHILHLSVPLALGSSDRWYIRKGIGLSYYMKGARNPPPLMTSRKVYALYQEFIPVTKKNLDTLLYL